MLESDPRLLSTVVDAMREGIAIANPAGQLVYFNAAATEILGRGVSGGESSSWGEEYGVFLPDMRTPYPTDRFPLLRALKGENVDGDLQFIRNPNRPHGVFIEVNSRRIVAPDGIVLGAVAVFHDVTARIHHANRYVALHRISRVLNERLDVAHMLSAGIDEISALYLADLVVLLRVTPEKSGRLQFSVEYHDVKGTELATQAEIVPGRAVPMADTSFSDLLGTTQGRLIADLALETTPFEQRLAAVGLHAAMLTPVVTHSRLIGVLIVAARTLRPYLPNDLETLSLIAGTLAMAMRNAALYAELEAAYLDLQKSKARALEFERIHAMGKLAAGLAHDLNNALSPIVGFSELLLGSEVPSDRRVRYLESIRRGADDAVRLVRKLRTFYRKNEGEPMLPVDLNALVRQVVDSTEPRWRSEAQARSQLIQVQVEPAPDLPLMIGNSGELRDALVNLVLNAVDAMPQGGTLTLRTFSRADTMVGIEVRDTGIGMDAQTRSRIFEPFFTTKRDKGTGLGLSMVWGVVLRHGGSIDVQSEVGRGTTFRLEFPSRHGLEQTPTASGRLHATQSLKVLCVDDDPALRDVVRELLEIIGHRVFLAPSGEDALRLFHALGPIDLVITDMGMPGMNGAELASKLKALNPRVPIILLSGWSEQMNEAGELPASVDAALAKPPRLVELRNLIDELMAKSKSQSTTSASL